MSSTLEDLADDGAADVVNVKVDLRLSLVKLIHANWIIHTHNKISTQRKDFHAGFIKAGLCSHSAVVPIYVETCSSQLVHKLSHAIGIILDDGWLL